MAPQPAPHPVKRGSAMTDKQFSFAVKDGHPLRVVLAAGEVLTLGYILGLDDYHVALIDHDLAVHLVHKSVPCFTILESLSLDRDTHPNVEVIRERTAGFRERVLKDHFRTQPAKEHLE